MLECPKFNPVTDFQMTEPDLAIDIQTSISEGVMRGASLNLAYENSIKEPSEIGSYVRDNIDALQIAKNLKESMSAAKKARAQHKATPEVSSGGEQS